MYSDHVAMHTISAVDCIHFTIIKSTMVDLIMENYEKTLHYNGIIVAE